MKVLHNRSAQQIAILTQKVFGLERCGQYDQALYELKELWADSGSLPEIDGLEPKLASEILMRCGSVYGFHGHLKQIKGAQEISKNLLTEARSRYLEISATEKISECENYLALAYWRTGEINEARLWIEEALSHSLPISCDQSLYARATQSLINISSGNYGENISSFAALESDFRIFGDSFLNGVFCANLGVSYKQSDLDEQALNYFQLSKFYFEKARHNIYLAVAENNLAMLFKKYSRFDKAHAAIDGAVAIFQQLSDETRTGFALDTKAQIHLSEEKYDEALTTADAAVIKLKKSENTSYLIEAIMTRSKAQLYLNDFAAATLGLIEAVEIAKVQTGEASVIKLIQDFESVVNRRKNVEKTVVIPQMKMSADDEVQIVLPPSLSHYKDFQGIWMHNSDLEKTGLTQGSLAIVVKEKVKRGDLVAISESGSDAVICGFYDADFGIVCIEGIDADPQLFDEGNVSILGKIVGFCTEGSDAEGKMTAEPLLS